ncbi:MAG: rhodanese-like domain-containing protein [Candidatus Riflebacteria bacterium]|nr:rhodanese-like domain-containing protein [Candidatus Riflebacteria bacterium]
MVQTVLRLLAIVILGALLGFGWNSFGGRGIQLDRNVFVKDEDEVIELAEARARFARGALFLDAREMELYRLGHIPGAISVPEGEFEKAFPRLEPMLRSRFDLVVYCSGLGCEASHTVSRWLRQRGIQAAIFTTGWPAWSEAGQPTKKGDEP